jgi:hypothetical protein
MVLLSTPGLPLVDILRAQIKRGAPSLVAPTDRAIAAVQATGHVPADLPRELDALFPPYAGPFLQKLLAFDPAATLLASKTGCLVIQGAADRQVVPMEDVQPLIDAMAKRNAPGEAVVVPGVSHNLKLVQWPNDSGFAGPIAPVVAARLREWLPPTLGV